MSAMARTTYRRSLRSNGASFDKPQRDEQHIACTSGSSTDFPVSDPLPLFFSDLQDQPDLQKFKPFAISQWTSILARVLAGGLVASAFAILVLIGNATRDQATQPASNQPATRQTLLNDDPARASDSVTRDSVNTSAPQLETPSREEVVSGNRTAQRSQTPAARTRNEGAAPSKRLDAETLAALMTRAKSLLALGDVGAARLLLERAANAQDATAAFLLARTYDPAVLGVRDTRSVTPDPAMARDWYRKAASLGSTDAQQRLTQTQK
jgi:hypothetical protein